MKNLGNIVAFSVVIGITIFMITLIGSSTHMLAVKVGEYGGALAVWVLTVLILFGFWRLSIWVDRPNGSSE